MPEKAFPAFAILSIKGIICYTEGTQLKPTGVGHLVENARTK